MLRKFGWTGHCGNVPAAYLTGFLAGLKALKLGIKSAVLDIGLQTSTKGNALYAAAKGGIDAGLEIPVGSEVMPSENRIMGEHISEKVKANFQEVKSKIEKEG
jgi:large subunit ribosomal protein L18